MFPTESRFQIYFIDGHDRVWLIEIIIFIQPKTVYAILSNGIVVIHHIIRVLSYVYKYMI